jgi:hypothetical protein
MHWVGLMVDLSNPPLRQNSICEVATTLSDGSLEVKLTSVDCICLNIGDKLVFVIQPVT